MKTLATGFCMHRNAHKYESCIQTFTEYVGRLRGWCQSESEHGEAIFVTVHYWQIQKSPSHVIDTYYAYSQFKDRRTNSCTHPVYLVKFHTDGISEFPSSSVKKKKKQNRKKKIHNLVSIWAFASTTAAHRTTSTCILITLSSSGPGH